MILGLECCCHLLIEEIGKFLPVLSVLHHYSSVFLSLLHSNTAPVEGQVIPCKTGACGQWGLGRAGGAEPSCPPEVFFCLHLMHFPTGKGRKKPSLISKTLTEQEEQWETEKIFFCQKGKDWGKENQRCLVDPTQTQFCTSKHLFTVGASPTLWACLLFRANLLSQHFPTRLWIHWTLKVINQHSAGHQQRQEWFWGHFLTGSLPWNPPRCTAASRHAHG